MFNWRNLFGGQQQGLLGPQGLPYQDVQPQQPMSLLGVHGPNGVVQNPPPAPQSKGNWADNLFSGGLLGQDVGLSPDAQKGARNQALLMAGLSMMANSSRRPGSPTGLGEILLGGLQAGQQGYGQSLRSGLAGQEFKTKQAAQQASRQAGQGLDWTKPESWAEYAARLDAIPGRESDAQAARKYYAELSKPKDKPADVQEYEYARSQGYQGTFADFTKEMKRAGASNVTVSTAPPVPMNGEGMLFPELPSGLKAPTGFGFDRNGNLQPIPGGEKDPDSTLGATEAERTAAFLQQRLEAAERIMSSPELASVQKPEVGPAILGAIAGETAGNLVRSGPRQQYEAAMVDAVDAALTLATGAAYTEEQIAAMRKAYIPQLGDKPETVEQKARSRAALIQAAKAKSGRMANSGPAVPPLLERPPPSNGGWSIKKVGQ